MKNIENDFKKRSLYYKVQIEEQTDKTVLSREIRLNQFSNLDELVCIALFEQYNYDFYIYFFKDNQNGWTNIFKKERTSDKFIFVNKLKIIIINNNNEQINFSNLI